MVLEERNGIEQQPKSELPSWAKLPRAVLRMGFTMLKPVRLLWPPELVLAVGFATTETDEPATVLGVEVDWSERDQPAIKTPAGTAALVSRKEPAADLTP